MNSVATNVLAPFLSRMDEFILFLRSGLNEDEKSDQDEKKQEVNNQESQSDDNFRGRLDTAFPLSGGETDEDLRSGTDDDDEEEERENSIFRHRLDIAFPLSGGETDEDLDRATE